MTTLALHISYGILIFCGYMFFRNLAVYAFVMRILEEDHRAARKKLDAGESYFPNGFFPRHDKLDYNTMMFRFWVWPLSRFLK